MQTGIFYLDGVSSMDYNLYSVDLNDPITTLIGGGSIFEKTVPFSPNPVFNEITRTPYDIPLLLALVDDDLQPLNWTPIRQQKAVQFLVHKEYKELKFDEDISRLHYVLCSGDIKLHTFSKQGYISISFRTNSAYAYRPERELIIDSTTTTKTETIFGDEFMAETSYPIIDIARIGTTNGILEIYKQGGKLDYVGFKDLGNISNIRIFTKQRIIKDMDTGKFLYHLKDKTTGDKWIDIVAGENSIALSKGWKATLKYQEAIY